MQDATASPLLPANVRTEPAAALRSRWRLLIACTVAGALLGALALVVLPRQYEALGIVKIGQVAGKVVETAPQAVERVGLESFAQAVGVSYLSVSARVVRGAEMIELKFRGASPDEAIAGVRKLFETLRARHDELAQPQVKRMEEQLAEIMRMEGESRQRRDQLAQELRSAVKGPIKDEYPYLQLAFVGRDVEVARWAAALRADMGAPNTEPTRLVEAIAVPEKAVSPRPGRIVALGAAAGLAVGLALALTRARVPQHRSEA